MAGLWHNASLPCVKNWHASCVLNSGFCFTGYINFIFRILGGESYVDVGK